MKLTFIESEAFSGERDELFAGDSGYRKFQYALMENPQAGTPIPHTAGVRKVRWASENQGKGKRGGIRILYLYLESESRILLLKAYRKNELDNPSPKLMKKINDLAKDERS